MPKKQRQKLVDKMRDYFNKGYLSSEQHRKALEFYLVNGLKENDYKEINRKLENNKSLYEVGKNAIR